MSEHLFLLESSWRRALPLMTTVSKESRPYTYHLNSKVACVGSHKSNFITKLTLNDTIQLKPVDSFTMMCDVSDSKLNAPVTAKEWHPVISEQAGMKKVGEFESMVDFRK